MSTPRVGAASAQFDGLLARDLIDVVDLTSHPEVLDRTGWWAVVATFEGAADRIPVRHRRTGAGTRLGRPAGRGEVRHRPPGPVPWTSARYRAGVGGIRDHIAAGEVYQVNLCRILTAALDPEADPYGLAARLAAGNPAPYQGVLDLADEWIVTASPELFLSRDGDVLHSAPIKGTAVDRDTFADKDFPENIMITDLVRNDLGRIARARHGRRHRAAGPAGAPRAGPPGVDRAGRDRARSRMGGHPGRDIPAGFGRPAHRRLRALQVISELEPVPRGPYCGAIGYVDADRRRARLAVGIRTFYTSTAEPDGTRGCTSAPGPASPGRRTRPTNGTRPNSRRPDW